MHDENESYLTGYPNPINYKCTKKILEQMEKNICKIKIEDNQGTGFFCKIPFPDLNNMLTVFITNNHIIDKKYLDKQNSKIQLDIKEKTDKININLKNRMKYTNEEYDITIIEIKEKDNIENYLELDDIILDDILNTNNQNKEYEDKTIYIIQYPKGELSVSYGILSGITLDKIYNFNHKCSTEKGSSGSPILALNNKVFGIHKKGSNNLNKGTFLNFPIKEFINSNYNNKNNKVIDKYKKINNINNKNPIDDISNDSEKEVDIISYKIAFIGDYCTGKTEIINKLLYLQNPNESCIGLNYLRIKYENPNIELRIYDTTGDERYKAILTNNIRGSSLVFLIYNVSSRNSFEGLKYWIDYVYRIGEIKIVICGNKINLKNREVDEKEGEDFAKDYGLTFFEIDSINSVRSMFFHSIAELLIFKGKISDKKKFVKELIEKDDRKLIKANNEKNKRKKDNNTNEIDLKNKKNGNFENCFIV